MILRLYNNHILSRSYVDRNTIQFNRLCRSSLVNYNLVTQRSLVKSKSFIYEKKTPLEHILLRPGMYIGQTATSQIETWVYNESERKVSKETIAYNPALLKLFDEILINAADNKQRDSTMSNISINITYDFINNLEISIYNNGQSIPIEIHKKENIYIPELIFGHLLTGSNFNDADDRLTGGSHGYGAKLTNIFSKSFDVEIYNHKKQLLYNQSWNHNMSHINPPTILHLKSSVDNNTTKYSENYTKVTFRPDLKYFGLETNASSSNSSNIKTTDATIVTSNPSVEDNTTTSSTTATTSTTNYSEIIEQVIVMFQRRALDVAACIAPMQVDFNYNGKAFTPALRSFKEYIELFKSIPHVTTDSTNTSNSLMLEEHTSLEPLDHNSTHNSNISTSEDIEDVANTSMVPSLPIKYSKVNPRWEVGIGLSDTGVFEQMSFVNNVWTVRGGTHVNMILNQVIKAIENILTNKKKVAVSTNAIRNKILLFVNCQITNPMFEGQTKDSLNSKVAEFGSVCKLSDEFLKEVIKSTGIIDSILYEINMKNAYRMLSKSKTNKKLVIDVPKLEDAHKAGSKDALNCTLILTEGDSAKALAVAGLEVVGRELYGVIPLRGKILNVRVASNSQLHKNEELMNLCKALGLDFSKTYADGLEGQGLRYGKVMIMCDQDTDGSHIKGLVINLFHHFWPSLLKHEGYLQHFITPIVKAKAISTNKQNNKTLSFYSIPEYVQWLTTTNTQSTNNTHTTSSSTLDTIDMIDKVEDKQSTSTNIPKYTIKYYKGLGTNTASEGRDYFKQLLLHLKLFQASKAKDEDSIDLAFNKLRVQDRRDWITKEYKALSYINPKLTSISYEEFINKELIQFSYSDIHRSIPNIIDGLKPSQRKVLYGCFKKKLLKEEAKVVQIAGYIAEHTAYHHGESSLHATIINMAQDFVGSNNVPLLTASGQFGTRSLGGKDFASPRYVFTKLQPITRLLYPEEDDYYLDYLEEDGQLVEPRYFIPVIPTLLLNGSQGIGTGWSTSIPTYHLPHVVEAVRHHILTNNINNSNKVGHKKKKKYLEPYVVGFKGQIQGIEVDGDTINTTSSNNNNNNNNNICLSPMTYQSSGIISRINSTQLEITELPVGIWTDDYKGYLCKLVENGSIKEFKEYHSTDNVKFLIIASKAQIDTQVKKGLHKIYRLHSTISLNNMHAFDKNGQIKKYNNPEEIIKEHYEVRYAAYQRRKEGLERIYYAEELKSKNKSQFITDILKGNINIIQKQKIAGRSEYDIYADLKEKGYLEESQIQQIVNGVSTEKKPVKDTSASPLSKGYAYLLDMPIHSLTEERSLALQKSDNIVYNIYILNLANEASQKLAYIKSCQIEDLWLNDIDKIIKYYEKS